MADRDWREIMRGCDRWLGSRRSTSAADVLRAAADALAPEARPDRYVEGAVVEAFERRIAELLGKDAAVLMPSGTMAQQIALRIQCDRRGIGTVGFTRRATWNCTSGDEFVVLFPTRRRTPRPKIGERIRNAVTNELTNPAATVSIGASVPDHADGRRATLDVDRALYAAKQRGRNQVAFA